MAVPIDPDVDPGSGPDAALKRRRPGTRVPRISWRIVIAVVIGGFLGGLARYGLSEAWAATAGTFPWAIFTVNTAGSFILALVLILVLEVMPPTRYVRALVGTGFCGALTTFSSVATEVDQLAAHGHSPLAAGYLLASLAAGMTAGILGIVVGRSLAAARKGRKS